MSIVTPSPRLVAAAVALGLCGAPAMAGTRETTAETPAPPATGHPSEQKTATQGAPARPKTVFDGDYLTVGAAVGVSPPI